MQTIRRCQFGSNQRKIRMKLNRQMMNKAKKILVRCGDYFIQAEHKQHHVIGP